jgi:formylglycine-generating enzyme required for sulfatase activity
MPGLQPGTTRETPGHMVYVSAFYMAKHEVTKSLWDEVRDWAITRDYSIAAGAAKADDHPVHSISWWDAVRWCNARTEYEISKGAKLEPVYRNSDGTIHRNDRETVSSGTMIETRPPPRADWSARGYRLPTEAEWERAARGGVERKNYPWGGNHISHKQANYQSDDSFSYDSSRTQGYHPDYGINTVYGQDPGPVPFTSPVGSFAPTGKWRLYDLAGNLSEWCWDRYGSSYDTRQTKDPRGLSGWEYLSRVVRGGSWHSNAYGCRVARRNFGAPTLPNIHCGFRLARSFIE